MSAKSRERKQKYLAREQALQSSQNAPPPAATESKYIHPIMFHPIEYHDGPPSDSDIPRPISTADAPSNPPSKNSISMTDALRSGLVQQPIEGFDCSRFVKEAQTVDASKLLSVHDAEMKEAMTPRNADGTPLKNMVKGQIVRAKIPAFDNPANPTPDTPLRPIAYAKEFADGKVPDGFHYVDGFATCVEGPDGKPMQTTFYADPVRNLTSQDLAALELGRKMLQQNPAQQSFPDLGEDPLSEENNLDHPLEIGTVTDCPAKGCLTVITKKGMCRLTNFRIIPIESRLILGKLEREEPRLEYTFEIHCGVIRKPITIGAPDLDNIVKVIQANMPICTVTPTVLKSSMLISNYVRELILDQPQMLYVQHTGFMKLNGAWIYVHDRAIPPGSGIVFNTGRYIPDRPGVPDAQAFHDALRFLDISQKDELILILFLLAHLGPLFQLFHETGRTPRFVTILVGRSGSLKTSISLILYRLFADQGRTPTATFKDTETALEIKLGQLFGTTGIFDDFRPPVSDLKSKINAEKLESIIRAVGDHVSKSRSNVKLERAKEFIPSGSVLVTAEDLSGSHSSYLRSLILSIGKGDIDGSKLRFFQNNPDIIPAHMNRFLRWIGQHGDEVINRIRCEYPTALFENTVTELRLVDTAATLMMAAQLLGSYAEACGAMTAEQTHSFLSRCHTAISTAVVASEAMSREANPCVMHLEALFSLMERGEIRLAENMKMYVPELHDGFLSDQCAWMDADAVYAKVVKYYSRLNITFPLQERQLAVHLSDAQLIDIEPRQKGSSKHNYRRKSSLPNRKRMQVLHLDRAMVYLEENGNN